MLNFYGLSDWWRQLKRNPGKTPSSGALFPNKKEELQMVCNCSNARPKKIKKFQESPTSYDFGVKPLFCLNNFRRSGLSKSY